MSICAQRCESDYVRIAGWALRFTGRCIVPRKVSVFFLSVYNRSKKYMSICVQRCESDYVWIAGCAEEGSPDAQKNYR